MNNPRHQFQEPRLTEQAGKILSRLRHESGLSAQQLSKHIGKRLNFIEDIELGLYPINLADFVEIAQALELDPISVLREIISEVKSA